MIVELHAAGAEGITDEGAVGNSVVNIIAWLMLPVAAPRRAPDHPGARGLWAAPVGSPRARETSGRALRGSVARELA